MEFYFKLLAFDKILEFAIPMLLIAFIVVGSIYKVVVNLINLRKRKK